MTALFGAEAFDWLDRLRRTHFPPERNQVPAHLTLFHHLPPSLEAELDRRLREETRGVAAPGASATGLVSLGRGVALRVHCPSLVEIRDRCALAFEGLLTPQDRAAWRPHVTLQNKVDPQSARRTLDELRTSLVLPRRLPVRGLATWRYRGGPWEPARTHLFV